jgi:hypothetical protein
MYEQIVTALKSDSHREKDKRREPRVGMAGEAEFVTVDETGKRVAGTVRVRDVSTTGIGLFFSKQIEKQQRFVLQLYTSDQNPLWLVCRAAYCRRVEGGRFSVGAKINQILRPDQIQKMDVQSAASATAGTSVRRNPVVTKSDVERISKAILS